MPELSRKHFQIHLSTAIVMMFVAGVLIWANVRVRNANWQSQAFRYARVEIVVHGWPWDAYIKFVQLKSENRMIHDTYGDGLNIVNALFNLMVSIAILFMAWFVSESLIRRRAARNAP